MMVRPIKGSRTMVVRLPLGHPLRSGRDGRAPPVRAVQLIVAKFHPLDYDVTSYHP